MGIGDNPQQHESRAMPLGFRLANQEMLKRIRKMADDIDRIKEMLTVIAICVNAGDMMNSLMKEWENEEKDQTQKGLFDADKEPGGASNPE